ncbi:sulfur carrier protein ThiS [Afipia felis]|jgi:sulfur carrier protein|uniref:Sulfur carrier protein ThiS n=2 Tax=Afipia felis TaxID=1035 RepID=A0A380WBQ3_AFIFE|nr:sulfur carrier protein ThiS [Afipia felis]EKS29061.1 thiamine biosynthesis protein ThiS [Afipia felis ATCC 53690]SUU77768.1 sulfur carrier protein ThiS [Afipia felis]SUU85833.1 sulfur carrier protein ThiS [Afipia felis]
MFVTVNGERREIKATHVQELLNELEYEGTHLAVALNYDVVPRARWSETPLNDNDLVEILTPRQGG